LKKAKFQHNAESTSRLQFLQRFKSSWQKLKAAYPDEGKTLASKGKNMIFKKALQTAILITLAASIMTGAALVQNKGDDDIAPAVIYDGIQTAEGTLDPISRIR